MDTSKDEVYTVLIEIKDTLNRIFECFEEDYIEIQKKKLQEKEKKFNSMLSDVRRKIFPLLFDKNNYSQLEISQMVKTDPSTVSRFISQLFENGMLEQINIDGKTVYLDKYNFQKLVND